jgi:hypothetical protein
MFNNLTDFQKNSILAGISVLAVLGLFFIPAIPQDSNYHQFADQRLLLKIPHFFNVVSNILFILVGRWGIKLLICETNAVFFSNTYWMYMTFFVGIFFIGLGSGYYHLAPSNQTLIWDRLPMTAAFMTLFSITISEFISAKLGKIIFLPLLFTGILSIVYWVYTEQQGAGDLRFYGLVQFLPMLLIPLILLLFGSQPIQAGHYWYLLGFYMLSKIFEMADYPVYQLSTAVSGHSLKHIFAGIGCYFFYAQLKKEAHRYSTE